MGSASSKPVTGQASSARNNQQESRCHDARPPVRLKCAWITAEFEAGVDEIEVSSPVPPKLLPQFAHAEAVVAHAMAQPGLIVAVLVPNLRGAERGLALGVHKLNYVLSVSESHNLSNVRRSTAEIIADFKRIVASFRASPLPPILCCGIATSFGCSIEGQVHDTRGPGIANAKAKAALDVGVRHFDASLAGLGGCPFAPGATGNIVSEDFAFLCESLGYDTGIDIEALVRVRKYLAEGLPGTELLGNLAKAGLPVGFTPALRRIARAAE